jgi:hypothetical protein
MPMENYNALNEHRYEDPQTNTSKANLTSHWRVIHRDALDARRGQPTQICKCEMIH